MVTPWLSIKGSCRNKSLGKKEKYEKLCLGVIGSDCVSCMLGMNGEFYRMILISQSAYSSKQAVKIFIPQYSLNSAQIPSGDVDELGVLRKKWLKDIRVTLHEG